MAGPGARSDRGNVRGALADEFTHVITPAMRNRVLKQNSTVLRRRSAGGVLAITVGFLLQTAALGNGQLSVVEPLLVLELPATLYRRGWPWFS